MTAYVYATQPADIFQHLLPQRDAPALCGAVAFEWHFGPIATRNFPGVPLCEECKELRTLAERQAKADAEQRMIDAERVRIKTFWTDMKR